MSNRPGVNRPESQAARKAPPGGRYRVLVLDRLDEFYETAEAALDRADIAFRLYGNVALSVWNGNRKAFDTLAEFGA